MAREPGPKQRACLANIYRDLGLRQRDCRRHKESAETHQKAIDLWSQLHRDFPSVPDYARSYALVLFFAGQDLINLDRDRPALEHLTEAERLYTQLVKDFPAKKEYGQKLSWCCFTRGWLLAASSNAQVRNPAAAIEPARRAAELAPGVGKHWAALGMAYYRAGNWQDALQALKEASRRAQPPARIDLFFLAMTHWRMGHKEEARECYGQAVAWLEKNQPHNEQMRGLQAEAAQLLGIPVQPMKGKEGPARSP